MHGVGTYGPRCRKARCRNVAPPCNKGDTLLTLMIDRILHDTACVSVSNSLTVIFGKWSTRSKDQIQDLIFSLMESLKLSIIGNVDRAVLSQMWTLWLWFFWLPFAGQGVNFFTNLQLAQTLFFNVYWLARTFFFGTHVSRLRIEAPPPSTVQGKTW